MSDDNDHIVEFLLARISEDEVNCEGTFSGSHDPKFLWGPDRIRAESASKRALLRDIAENYLDHPGGVASTDGLAGRAIEYLLQPYVDHPDYDPSWR